MIKRILLCVLLACILVISACYDSKLPEETPPAKLQTFTVTCYCDHFLETCICGGRVYKLYIQAEVEEMPEL